MNKLHSTNELTINLPDGHGIIEPHTTVIPTSSEHQMALENTGWFRVGAEIGESKPVKPEPEPVLEEKPEVAVEAETVLADKPTLEEKPTETIDEPVRINKRR